MFGFITVVNVSEDWHGCLLVLDENGFPLKTYRSTKITQNKLQLALYGSNWMSYICNRVIGPKLLSSVDSKCSEVYTNIKDFNLPGIEHIEMFEHDKIGQDEVFRRIDNYLKIILSVR